MRFCFRGSAEPETHTNPLEGEGVCLRVDNVWHQGHFTIGTFSGLSRDGKGPRQARGFVLRWRATVRFDRVVAVGRGLSNATRQRRQFMDLKNWIQNTQ